MEILEKRMKKYIINDLHTMETVSYTPTDRAKNKYDGKAFREAQCSPLIQKLLKGGGITLQIRQVTTLGHTNSAIQHMDGKNLQKCLNKHGLIRSFKIFSKT